MARKQEQEPAQPDVSEVAPGVLRMQLPIRMPGLAHVNCYALLDDDGAAVVDPGLPGPRTWRALKDRLRQAGVPVRHVHTVIVTHSHPDHFGCAARFASVSGARVIGHESFSFGPSPHAAEPEVSVDDLTPATEEPTNGASPWGGLAARPPWAVRMKWRLFALAVGRSFVPEITQRVRGGDVLRLAKREWRVVHTPGHTSDHICLYDTDTGAFLAGDHVLPTITPHISGLTQAADPLQAFLDSLDRVAELRDVATVLPAHGHPFSDLPGRVQDIKRHHHERLAKMERVARELGPATVEQFSHQLFQERHWGWMAESETFAHLEHLRLAGRAERHTGQDGKLVYVAG